MPGRCRMAPDQPLDGVDLRSRQFLRREFALIGPVDARSDLEAAVPAHVLQRGQTLLGCRLGEAGDDMLEDPAVVLIHGELLARTRGRLEVCADAEGTVGVDAPG